MCAILLSFFFIYCLGLGVVVVDELLLRLCYPAPGTEFCLLLIDEASVFCFLPVMFSGDFHSEVQQAAVTYVIAGLFGIYLQCC